MRAIEAISPTSLKVWETDRELFYQRYLSDNRPPRQPQTEAMAVGSAFDAYVKCELQGEFCSPPGFGLEELLAAQVDDPIMIPRAKEAGAYLMDCYEECGALDDLRELLSKTKHEPRFEFKIVREIGGVPLQGKPDCWFYLDTDVILDWKVNGYCGSSATSPRPAYKMCYDAWNTEQHKPTRGGNKAHKKYKPIQFGGMEIGNHWLEDVDKGWADQLAVYGWMLGFEVGSENFITCLDQLACKPGDPYPLARVAQHRCRISAFWQFTLLERLQRCWESIQSGHIFTDLSKEESVERCALIDTIPYGEDDEFWALCGKKGFMG